MSENKVKTHAGRLFTKLDARRRTQAVQRAKEALVVALVSAGVLSRKRKEEVIAVTA